MGAASLVIEYEYRGGRVSERRSEESAKAFMLGGGAGIYTAMRTVCGGQRVFLLDDHLQRIVDSHRAVLAGGPANDAAHWRALLVPLLRRGLQQVRHGESKITVLVGADGVRIQFAPLLQAQPGRPCWVRFASGHREHPEAKSLQWVHEREALERLIVPPVDDVVLVDDAAAAAPRFYEGTSSNFFVVRRVARGRQPEFRDFELLAAPLDCVLLGTVMRLVLRICRRDGIPVVHDGGASAAGMADWAGAFISSTSRLVLPVERILYGAAGQCHHALDPANALVTHLQHSVLSMAEEQSSAV
ncbi:hypothetical protein H4R18_000600 [Coemansia javaensis]|uniref:Uncharacterized protein n=1 Tax=Coemansia javaensis TaxID=2761396 RepID=A0A9W8LKC1_9FUNG|nr:hypothetical protein H4R18_000600 [Coemansia javaensis]